MEYIYCLRLENNRYYIGKTSAPDSYYDCHLRGEGAKWTQVNKPVGVDFIAEFTSFATTTDITRQYMKKYGVDNVRGSGYSQVVFTQSKISNIESKINNLEKKCCLCNTLANHFTPDHFNADHSTRTEVSIIPTGKILYILELVNGKYYVGATKNIESRIDQHKNNLGS